MPGNLAFATAAGQAALNGLPVFGVMKPGKILIIGYVWPEPESSAAGVRTVALARLFRDAGWETHLASSCRPNAFQDALTNQEGIPTHLIQVNDSGFDPWIAALAPDVVLFDRFVTEEQFGWRVRAVLPEALRVIDTQDLHGLRRARQRAFEAGAGPAEIENIGPETLALEEDTQRELAAIYRSDLTLLISSYEHDLLRRGLGVPSTLIHCTPFQYGMPPASPPFEERSGFVMVGNFRHPPNADAVRWLAKELWPAIRAKLPDAFVHVYGAYPPKELMALSNRREGLEVLGHAANLFETLSRYRVSLAPLRFGAGIKGKIAESWRAGMPVVTTPIGAEGMCDPGAFGGSVEREPSRFALAAAKLHESAEDWACARKLGYSALDATHNAEKNGRLLLARVAELRENRGASRARNAVGLVLWQQQLRSTEYFSRWIELKERQKNLASGSPKQSPQLRE